MPFPPAVNERSKGRDIRDHRRSLHGHCLKERRAETFKQRRIDKDIYGSEYPRDVLPVAEKYDSVPEFRIYKRQIFTL